MRKWVLLIVLLLVPLFAQLVPVSAQSPPRKVHLTYSINDPSRSVTITWETRDEVSSVVKYDTEPRGGDPDAYEFEAYGTVHTYAGASGYIHDVVLNDLQPNTTYYFVCGSPEGGWSQEMAFRTAPLIPEKIVFVAGGDSRTNPDKRDAVSELMAQYSPEFVLYTGDAVDSGHEQSLWDDWFNSMQQYWVTPEGYRIPILPCLGNHEENAVNYYKQYALPGNEQWYSIDYTPYLHIVCLNSETSLSGDQLEWLEADLKAHQDVPWIVVFFHRPPYSASRHGSSLTIRRTWCPVFDQYGVDFVFNGHDHCYERTKPIKGEQVADSYLNGTCYVVTGGWGAPLYGVGEEWWTAYSESCHHFCLVEITVNGTSTTLTLKAIRRDGTLMDSLSVTKENVAPPPLISQVSWEPSAPRTGDNVQVRAYVTDYKGLERVYVRWTTDGWQTVHESDMVGENGGLWTASLGSFPEGTTLEFEVVEEVLQRHVGRDRVVHRRHVSPLLHDGEDLPPQLLLDGLLPLGQRPFVNPSHEGHVPAELLAQPHGVHPRRRFQGPVAVYPRLDHERD